MNFSGLIAELISVLKGNSKIPVYREYGGGSLDSSENIFAAVGISQIKTDTYFSDSKGTNCYRVCDMCCKVIVFGKNTDGEAVFSTAEEMLLRLFSSGLNISSVECGEISYNTKLGRVQYDFSVMLNTRLLNGEVIYSYEKNTVMLSDKLIFTIDSYEFDRTRGLDEIETICDGIVVGDKGIKPLNLKLCGNILASSSIAITLDEFIALGRHIDLSCMGLTLPPMILKEYHFKGEKGSAFCYCELVLWSADSSGVTAVG